MAASFRAASLTGLAAFFVITNRQRPANPANFSAKFIPLKSALSGQNRRF
jgi:hypothetical protein